MNNHLSLRTRQLMTNTRPIAKFVSFLCIILCVAPTVSAKEIDLENLDVSSLIAKMTPLKGTTPAQWRVVWTGDASREATISWTTAEPGKTHLVH